jgi:hypothetical protein
MLSRDDYLRATSSWSSAGVWDLILLLASPLALGLAALGARPLWQRSRPAAAVCAVLGILYLNEIWLSPFAMRSAMDLLRGLSVLSFPVAIAGGFALAARPRAAPWLLGACALFAVFSTRMVIPRSCHVREVSLDELQKMEVARCTFRWRGPAQRPWPRGDALLRR